LMGEPLYLVQARWSYVACWYNSEDA